MAPRKAPRFDQTSGDRLGVLDSGPPSAYSVLWAYARYVGGRVESAGGHVLRGEAADGVGGMSDAVLPIRADSADREVTRRGLG